MKRFNLTRQQNAALTFIRKYVSRHGSAPSYDEIANALDISSKSGVTRLVNGLERRGAITRLGRLPRSIMLVDQPNGAAHLPADLRQRVAAYCASHDEDIGSFVADAVVLHLDELEKSHTLQSEPTP